MVLSLICFGKVSKCILDTGSDVSFISFKLSDQTAHLKANPKKSCFKLANEKSIICTNSENALVNYKGRDLTPLELFIVEDLSYDFIKGLDAIKSLGISIHNTDGKTQLTLMNNPLDCPSMSM